MAENNIDIKITIDDKTKQGASSANRSIESIGKTTTDTIAKGTFLGITYAKAFNTIVTATVNAVREFGQLAQKSEALRGSFNNLAQAPRELLNAMKTAAKGTVSELDLIASANKAIALGVSQDMLPAMVETAKAASRVFGTDVRQNIEDISIGMGRQSKLILDNLGILVNLEQAQEDYARSVGKTSEELTEQEKKIAFNNAVLQAGKVLVDRAGRGQETLAEKLAKARAQIDNAKERLAVALLPTLAKLADIVANRVVPFLVGGFNAISRAVGPLVSTFSQGFSWLASFVDKVAKAIYKSLSWINPFARHSPSLVEQVKNGVSEINKSYSGLTVKDAMDKAKTSIKQFESSIKDQERALDKLNKQNQIYQGQLDDVKKKLDKLRGAKFEGELEQEKKIKNVDTERKRIQLSIVKLKQQGATDDSQSVKDLEKQLEVLDLQSEELELQRDLLYETQRDILEDQFNDEYVTSLATATGEVINLKNEEDYLTKAIEENQTQINQRTNALDDEKIALEKLREEYDAMAEVSAGGGGGGGGADLPSDFTIPDFQQTGSKALVEFPKVTVPKAWEEGLNIVKDVLGSFGDYLVSEVQPVIEAYKNYIQQVLDTIKYIWETNFAGIQNVASVVWNAIVIEATGVFYALKTVFEVGMDLIKGAFNIGIQLLQGDWNGAWGALKDTVGEILKDIEDNITAFVERVQGPIKGLWNNLTNLGDKAKEALGLGGDDKKKGKYYGMSIPETFEAVKAEAAKEKAGGGLVYGGDPYVVGEQGPELFVPASNGRIMPNSTTNKNMNITLSVGSVDSSNRIDQIQSMLLDAGYKLNAV